MRPFFRSVLACAILALSALGASACGEADRSPGAKQGSAASAKTDVAVSSAVPSVTDGDGDDDRPSSRQDPDNDKVFTVGRAASAAERQAIAALIARYYAAAAAGDVEKACSMLYAPIVEAIVEEHSHVRGAASLRGHTCEQVASKEFGHRRRELAEDPRTLEVTEVRVRASRGWVRLRFSPTREVLVFVHDTGGVWQMSTLLDAGAI